MKILKIIEWVVLLALVFIQFIGSEKNSAHNPDDVLAFEAERLPNTEVNNIENDMLCLSQC